MRYIISYDLNRPGQNYPDLWNELRSFNAQRVLQSQWVFVRMNTDAAQLREHFKQFLDRNDRLLITCLDNNNWASWSLVSSIPEG